MYCIQSWNTSRFESVFFIWEIRHLQNYRAMKIAAPGSDKSANKIFYKTAHSMIDKALLVLQNFRIRRKSFATFYCDSESRSRAKRLTIKTFTVVSILSRIFHSVFIFFSLYETDDFIRNT